MLFNNNIATTVCDNCHNHVQLNQVNCMNCGSLNKLNTYYQKQVKTGRWAFFCLVWMIVAGISFFSYRNTFVHTVSFIGVLSFFLAILIFAIFNTSYKFKVFANSRFMVFKLICNCIAVVSFSVFIILTSLALLGMMSIENAKISGYVAAMAFFISAAVMAVKSMFK